jgi:hypothetical protein
MNGAVEDADALGDAVRSERNGGSAALGVYEALRLGPARRSATASRTWSPYLDQARALVTSCVLPAAE